MRKKACVHEDWNSRNFEFSKKSRRGRLSLFVCLLRAIGTERHVIVTEQNDPRKDSDKRDERSERLAYSNSTHALKWAKREIVINRSETAAERTFLSLQSATGGPPENRIMFNRLQLLLCLCMIIGSVVAQVPAKLKFTLYHQLVHSNSAKDIVPRGVIKYDSTRNTAVYEEQSEIVDLSSGKGIYRIGIYDANEKELSPAAFTKLVLAPHTALTAGCCQRTSKGRDYAIPITRQRRLPHFLPPKTFNNIGDIGQRHPLQINPRRP
jgi:hypothetical protein